MAKIKIVVENASGQDIVWEREITCKTCGKVLEASDAAGALEIENCSDCEDRVRGEGYDQGYDAGEDGAKSLKE